jgi:hypothetical protein
MTARMDTRTTGRLATSVTGRRSAQGSVRMAAPVAGRAAACRTRRHALVAVSSPTCARLRVRLEAIGLGRWASLFTGARESGRALTDRRQAS